MFSYYFEVQSLNFHLRGPFSESVSPGNWEMFLNNQLKPDIGLTGFRWLKQQRGRCRLAGNVIEYWKGILVKSFQNKLYRELWFDLWLTAVAEKVCVILMAGFPRDFVANNFSWFYFSETFNFHCRVRKAKFGILRKQTNVKSQSLAAFSFFSANLKLLFRGAKFRKMFCLLKTELQKFVPKLKMFFRGFCEISLFRFCRCFRFLVELQSLCWNRKCSFEIWQNLRLRFCRRFSSFKIFVFEFAARFGTL